MMKLIRRREACFLAAVFVTLLVSATDGLTAQASVGQLTLERIFSSQEFSSERFGPARWLADGLHDRGALGNSARAGYRPVRSGFR